MLTGSLGCGRCSAGAFVVNVCIAIMITMQRCSARFPGWWRRYCALLCSDAALQRLSDLWCRCSVGAFVSVQLQPRCPCIA